MNNEPVAWMQIHYKDKMCITKYCPVKTWEDDIPLYTHPAKPTKVKFASNSCESGWIYLDYEEPEKTLTDEEKSEIIEKVWSEMKDAVCLDYKSFGNELIRAILKKAQEK